MFKNWRFIFDLLLLVIKLTKSDDNLNSNDFCQHEIMHKEWPCMGKYKYQCDTLSMCAISTKLCEKYDLISNVFDKTSMKKLKFIIKNTELMQNKVQKKSKQEFKKFKNSIPKCQMLDLLTKLCSNSQDCILKRKLVFQERTISIEIKKVSCKCQNDFKYQCNGKKYCANDLDSCEIIRKLDLNKLEIKDCENRNNFTEEQRLRYRL